MRNLGYVHLLTVKRMIEESGWTANLCEKSK